MRYTMKGLVFALLSLVIVTITACGGTKLKIAAHVEENLIFEFIMIKPTATKFEKELFDWYVKEDEEWVVQKEDWEHRFYLTSNHEATYKIKAVMKKGDKSYESNIVEVSFKDRYGHTFGVSPIGTRPSRHVDYSHDLGETNSYIEHLSVNKIEDQFSYFRNIHGTRYVISADIDIVGVNGSDPYPKTGLIAGQFSDRIIFFAFDSRASFDYNDIIIVNKSGDDGGMWHWPGTILNREVNFRKDGERSTHRLTVIRDVQTFYFLFDDEVIHTHVYEDFTFDTIAGTYTMAQNAIFSNYYAHMDDPNVDNDFYDLALLNARGF